MAKREGIAHSGGRWPALALSVALAAAALLAVLPAWRPGSTTVDAAPEMQTPPPPCAPNPGVSVCIVPAVQTVNQGSIATIEIGAQGVVNLGAFQVTVTFDPGLMSFVFPSQSAFEAEVQANLLGSSGRPVNCPVIDGGTPGRVRLVCITLGPTPPGADGHGVLARVRFNAFGQGFTPLGLTESTLLTPGANSIPVDSVAGGAMSIGPPATATEVPTATLTRTPTPTSTPCLAGGLPCTATPTITPTPTRTATPTQTPCLVGGVPCTATNTATSTNTPTATNTPPPSPTPPCGPVTGVAVCVIPPAQTIALGGVAQVDVAVQNVTNLGAFEVIATFDPALLTFVPPSSTAFTAEVQSLFLGSSGRTVNCPVIDVDEQGSVRVVCITLGTVPPPGADGFGTLVRLRFNGVAQGVSAVGLAGLTLLTPQASLIGVNHAFGGAVGIGPPDTPTPTATATATRTPTATGTPCLSGGAPCTATPTITATPTRTPTSSPTPCLVGGVPCTATNTATATATFTSTSTATPPPTPPCGPTPGRVVCIVPSSGSVGVGSQAEVNIAVQGLTDLGAFEVILTFDPGLTQFTTPADLAAFSTEVQSAFLGSSGRTVNCPIITAGIGDARVVCVTLGPPPPAGASGFGVLLTLRLDALQQGATPLGFAGVTLVRPNGQVMGVDAMFGGALAIGPPSTATNTPTPTLTLTPTITPTPCVVDDVPCTATPTFTASPTHTATNTPAPGTPTASPTPGGPTLMIVSPLTQTVEAGTNFTISIDVVSSTNVGAYEFRLGYDDALIDFVSVTNAGFLGSTGRTLFCPPAILDVGAIRFGCASSGPQAGPSGNGTLAIITLQAVLAGGSPLNLTLVALGDPEGDSQPVSPVSGSVGITSAPSGGGDPVTSSPTPVPSSTPESSPTHTPSPEATGDQDGDGVVNSIDNCPDMFNPSQANSDPEVRPNGPNVPGDDASWIHHDALGNVCDADDDNDGLGDAEELSGGLSCSGYETDPVKLDTDGDALADGWECLNGSDPSFAGSKYMGGAMGDADADRIPDLWERRGYNGTIAGPSAADTDADGCHDMVEMGSVDGNHTITDADRLAVGRRALGIWSEDAEQDYALDIDKNGVVGDSDRLFAARAALLTDWLPKSCS